MTKLICIGACYLDTILSVPFFPKEDLKLRATSLSVRRGGNCPNSLEVLQQLLAQQPNHNVQPFLVSCLPSEAAPATARILSSFGPRSIVDFSRCIFRSQHSDAASSYIIRSEASGTRTLVNYNDLPEMTVNEFVDLASGLVVDGDDGDDTWWHFEGRIPETTLMCIQHLRLYYPACKISVEVETPGREGLEQLAAEADVVFYSKTWAERKGYRNAAECLIVQSEVTHKATVGAGDTFIGSVLFGLLCHQHDWDTEARVKFGVQLATCKVQREGFDGVGACAMGLDEGENSVYQK